MKIIYEADDGTPFDDEYKCEEYEGLKAHPHIYDIIFQDSGCEILEPEDFKDGIFDDQLYQNCWGIVVHNKEEVSDLQWLSEYCGWNEFSQIDSPGVWVRFGDEEGDGIFDTGEWEKEDE